MCEHTRRNQTSNPPKSKLGLIMLARMGDLHELPQQIFRAYAGDLETPRRDQPLSNPCPRISPRTSLPPIVVEGGQYRIGRVLGECSSVSSVNAAGTASSNSVTEISRSSAQTFGERPTRTRRTKQYRSGG